MKDDKSIPVVLRKTIPPELEKIKYGHFAEDDIDYPVHMYLRENDITVREEGSEIVNFLKGKNILVTGATGFLGKLLIEKLLRSCKDIGTIYIIVRNKKGKDFETRLQEYLDDLIFYKLLDIYPNFKEKIHGIYGDFEKDEIGMSQESRQLLINEVNIIYHIAATVRFNEVLTKAIKINIVGTYEMLQLAKECKRLMGFVHISSAFSNCHKKFIEETFYAPHIDPYKMMNLLKDFPEDVIEKITPSLLGQVPNTYVFTKQIAENLVMKELAGIPCCIQRPSIVLSTASEPVRSWAESVFGPVGLVMGAVLGLLHVMYGNSTNRCDFVPADYVINHCIACSYKTVKNGCKDHIQIFNFTSTIENPVYWKDLQASEKYGRKVGSKKCLMMPFNRFTEFYYWYLLLNFWFHTVPSYIIDFGLVMTGKTPLLRKAYDKIDKFVNVLSYFTMNEWFFEYQNTTKLWNELTDVDKKNFNFDMKSLNWDHYFTTYLVSIREFILNEYLDNLKESRRHMTRLQIILYIVVATVLASSIYFFINTIFFFIPLMFISILVYFVVSKRNL